MRRNIFSGSCIWVSKIFSIKPQLFFNFMIFYAQRFSALLYCSNLSLRYVTMHNTEGAWNPCEHCKKNREMKTVDHRNYSNVLTRDGWKKKNQWKDDTSAIAPKQTQSINTTMDYLAATVAKLQEVAAEVEAWWSGALPPRPPRLPGQRSHTWTKDPN